jgi:hypothetical protein
MASTTFVATPSPADPAATQGLFPNWLLNPLGSEYAAQYGHDTTAHLQREIFATIVDSIPAQFGIFKILFQKQPEYKGLDEFTWFERLWPRPLLRASAGVAGGATQAIILTTNNVATVNDIIVYPDNTHGIITAVVNATNTITVAPYNGAANLPAVVANDTFVIESAPIADGMDSFVHYDRMQTIHYTNFIGRGQRNKRWTTMTAQMYKNNGTTNYFEKDAKEMMELAMQDMFAMFINGQKGEVPITVAAGAGLTAGTFFAKTPWGVFPFLQQNGAMHATSSPATLEADFSQLAFNSNYKNVNAPRFILGTDRALHAMASIMKDPIRYNPNDMVYNMDLDMYKIGTMRFIPMVVPLFESRSFMFPTAFENRLLVLDLDSIVPVCMRGYEPMSVRNTGKFHKSQGGYNDFIDYFVEYMVSMQMNNVDGNFWIDLINI